MQELGRSLPQSRGQWLDSQPDGPHWVEYTLPCGDTFITDTPLLPRERVWCQVHGWQRP